MSQQRGADRFALGAGALAIALALLLYFPTFHWPFAFDDLDYLNLGARMLSGELGVAQTIFYPHNEHVVPVLRSLFFPYLHFVGIDATAWRVGQVIVHALAALCLAIIARRYAGSARAGFATVIVYVGACGFTSTWIWFPTAATVPVMMLLLTASAALLTARNRLGMRRLLAAIGVVLALLAESSFAPMALLPAAIDEWERRREGRRGVGWFSVFTLACIAIAAVMMKVIIGNTGGQVSLDLANGLPRAAFLVLAAPFRFFFPGIPILALTHIRVALLICILSAIIAATVLALLAALWRKGPPPLVTVAALTMPGSLGVILLIGLGRAMFSYQTFYDTDRYFFPLMIPLALLAGAVVHSISLDGWPRIARVLLLTFVTIAGIGELALQRRALLNSIPMAGYVDHEKNFAALRRLTQMLDAAGPIELPRQTLWFPDLHNGRLRTEILTHVFCGNGRCPGVTLGPNETVDATTAARLNPILDRWARETGRTLPYIRVVDGRLVNTHLLWSVDFAQGDFANVVRGFDRWERPYRWMSHRGEITLTTGGPPIILVAAAPSDVRLRATLVDVKTKLTFALGTITVLHGSARSYSLPTKPIWSMVGSGRLGRLVLECEDSRPRCVQLFSAGSEAGS